MPAIVLVLAMLGISISRHVESVREREVIKAAMRGERSQTPLQPSRRRCSGLRCRAHNVEDARFCCRCGKLLFISDRRG